VPLVFHLIFHTHWDREWYLPEPAFRVRLVGMLDDVLDRLAAEPGFRSFLLDGQTILLEDYLGVRPERAGALRDAVAGGRLQIGPWYVLADEQIPAGESLVRNLLAGRADAERWGGRTDVLYSPDAFGHPAMLPDLAREFCLPAGVLWRGLGDVGGDLFRWRGPAGGELLVYHLPPDGYEVGAALPADAGTLQQAWPVLRSVLVQRAATRHVAVFVGADHHRAHPAPQRLRALLADAEPGHEVRISRLDEFLAAAAGEAGELPEGTGELRLSDGYAWTLQGTHGTRAPLKRRNAALELRLARLVEPLVALSGGGKDLLGLLDRTWRTLLANQFHDSICGTASDAVAQTMETRFAEVEALADQVTRTALHRTLGHDPDRARAPGAAPEPRLVLWNPAVRRRDGVVIAELTWFRRDILVGPPGARQPRTGAGARSFSVLGADGHILPVQVLGRRRAHERLDADRYYPDQDEVDVVRVAFEPSPIEGLGMQALLCGSRARPPRREAGSVSARGRRLANANVSVELGEGGAVALADRHAGVRLGGLLRLESSLDAGDSYTWAPAAGDREVRSAGPVDVRILARGPYVGVLEGRWSFTAGRAPTGPGRGRVDVRLVLRLHRGSPLVHGTLEIVNGGIDHRLRLRIPTGLAGAPLLTGAQFGVTARDPVSIDPAAHRREALVATAPAHRFAAVAIGPRGIAFFAPGFFEVEWTAAGDLLVTVLRAVGQLSRADLPTRPGHAGWPTPIPLGQCLGADRLEFALAPATAGHLARPERLHALWEDAFLPVAAWWLRDATGLASIGDQWAGLEGAGLVVSALKPATSGEGLVLRCYNAGSGASSGVWRFGAPRAAAVRVRADEREPRPAPLLDGGRVLPFDAAPGEWVTHLVR
jgi:mannosylglycerate hydrolase